MLQYLFFLVSIAEIIGELTGNDTLRFITKPLLMITLVVFYIQAIKGEWNKVHKLMIAALFFSWIGDVALMYEKFFLVGLVGFLITHILYTIAFSNVTDKQTSSPFPKKLWILVPLAIYMAVLLSQLVPGLSGNEKTKPLLIPVLAYTTAITTMAVFAVNRLGRVSDLSFKLVVIGALLFVLSDSMIAVGKFLHPFPYARFLIMFTYIAGQYLIVKGMLTQFSERKY